MKKLLAKLAVAAAVAALATPALACSANKMKTAGTDESKKPAVAKAEKAEKAKPPAAKTASN
jgi:hypothetical protein